MSQEFIEQIAELVGKEVEIYTNEQRETLKFADNDHARTCVIRGTLLAAVGACLKMKVSHPNTKKSHIIFLHSWGVNAIMERVNGVSVGDFYEEAGLVKRNKI